MAAVEFQNITDQASGVFNLYPKNFTEIQYLNTLVSKKHDHNAKLSLFYSSEVEDYGIKFVDLDCFKSYLTLLSNARQDIKIEVQSKDTNLKVQISGIVIF